jgi:hypothetical protein
VNDEVVEERDADRESTKYASSASMIIAAVTGL